MFHFRNNFDNIEFGNRFRVLQPYIYTTPRHNFGAVEIFLQTHLINNTYHIIAITIKMRI